MKLYIYSIPKAGTYFLASLIGKMGYENTGYHINATSYLDTLHFDAETNRERPSKTRRNNSFVTILRGLSDGQLAFGHFPAPSLPDALPGFKFVCAYRHPRKTLVSEFVDFRFRRKDVRWVLPQAIPDDNVAFETYLKRQGRAQERIFAHMLSVQLSVSEPSCLGFFPARFHFLNFDTLMTKPENTLLKLANFLSFEGAGVMDLFTQTLASETKTKATAIDLDRDALWTREAEKIYSSMSFDAIVSRGIKLGWDLEQSRKTKLSASLRLKYLKFVNRIILAFASR